MEEKIIEELFEKRADTVMQKPNKELDDKMIELAISKKEDEIIELFRKETNENSSDTGKQKASTERETRF